jgi:hypothetical protein
MEDITSKRKNQANGRIAAPEFPIQTLDRKL